ncbi:ferritin-like domain-containing protein [Rhodocytophaga aerolata]|uniref:Ferritin-like domain-containing protein n=1 Tax=Rhodocytophaga aerolata TaxID=455078 RepID=A0ABT8RIC9_9BACT|nr:ferritin-like domain-containing protein [Rhodocytophaga aerolata]MDO1451119.1 ferritin-like domain-containing protein [Rhodocytophaga aerolata]
MRVPLSNSKERTASAKNGENLRRRSFLKFAGFATASTAVMLSGCKEVLDKLPYPVDVDPDDYVLKTVRLGKGDTGVLNYAYTLEQLEAEFYIQVVAASGFASMFNYYEQRSLREIRDHEVVHRDFLKAALGDKAIGQLKFDFKAVNFEDKQSILQTAKTFEDLGVAAYNGAGKRLASPDLLTIAGKIVSVEARHASIIRSLVDTDPTSFAGDDIIDMNGLDLAYEPAKVLEAANPFILNKIDASEL